MKERRTESKRGEKFEVIVDLWMATLTRLEKIKNNRWLQHQNVAARGSGG
jgi:hypothetical protein